MESTEAVFGFSKHLKDRFLSDNYGGWKNLDPIFLESLCDRIEHETAEFISDIEIDHSECDEEIHQLKCKLDDALENSDIPILNLRP